MAAAARRQILLAGLSANAIAGVPTGGGDLLKRVQGDVQRAQENGFDCKVIFLDPADHAGAMDEAYRSLKEKQWDGFSVGFGVRGNPDYTALFEDLVNAARTITPAAIMMFPSKPDGIFDAIKRTMPEA